MSLEQLKQQTEYSDILFEPYLDWCAGEGIPVIDDFCVDLHRVETRPWARTGVNGAFVHLKGRGDFISVFLYDLPPGAKTAPMGHLYEAVFLVVEGHGSTTVELSNGRVQSFEWGPNSVFAIPLNARYRMFNGSGSEPARLAATTNLTLIMNLIHDDAFIFANGWRFPDREGRDESYYEGGGAYVPSTRGREMWETNFVADIAGFQLRSLESRGAGSTNIQFNLAEGNLHVHCSEMQVGTYKKAHRHPPDYHVFIVSGEGYSLFWYEGEPDYTKFEWRHGSVFAPPGAMFHQHFNTARTPARYMATAMGSTRYPFTDDKRKAKMGIDQSVKGGGNQIEYDDQDPRIHRMYLEALAEKGIPCRMGEVMDESRLPR